MVARKPSCRIRPSLSNRCDCPIPGPSYGFAVRTRVTIKHVATACGMAVPSVSQILNGKGSYRPETRERVRALARELGYRPNAYAQAMQSGRFNAVALVIATPEGRTHLEPQLVLALEETLAATQRHLVIARLPNERLTEAGHVPGVLRQLLVDGLLITHNAAIPARMQELIAELSLPTISINHDLTDNAVHPDDFAGVAAATEQLIALGHRAIAYADFSVGRSEEAWHYSTRARREGYCAAMTAAGLATDLWIPSHAIPGDDRFAAALARLQAPSRPTAIVCYNTDQAGPLLLAATKLGIAIPDALSLITVDVSIPRVFGRPVATLVLPLRALAAHAIAQLDRRLGDLPAPTVRVPLTLELAGTVGPPPATGTARRGRSKRSEGPDTRV